MRKKFYVDLMEDNTFIATFKIPRRLVNEMIKADKDTAHLLGYKAE